jgi:7,8-dihydropterin-6-yl-methyl-4-(beta-D-ribofuranosyl)aminobenzene 5'-phosphate synthase
MMGVTLNEVDRMEVLTLQDNFVDIASMDDTKMVRRAIPVRDSEVKVSILAEHGFSALITVVAGDNPRSVLFDFGFSEHGSAFNADALGLDLSNVETLVLSHGHMDHFGGLLPLVERIGKKRIELVLHPTAFRQQRYVQAAEGLKLFLPSLNREKLENAGIMPVESKDPYSLLDGRLLFLGQIPQRTDFETGDPRLHYDELGTSHQDHLEDDTAVVAHVKEKGLVILSGCAHAGIVNTVKYAQALTGVDRVYAVMGGFHLTGAVNAPAVEPTIAALKELNPQYIVPTHCTGRQAAMRIEKEMPEKFLLNMSGTKMIFATQ